VRARVPTTITPSTRLIGKCRSHAFEYIKHAGGLSTEFSYPYHAKDQKCSFNASASSTAPQSACCVDSTRSNAIDATPSTPTPPTRRSNGIGIRVPGGSVNLTKGDEGALKYYLATKGPVSVAFDVASDSRDYSSGVYSSTVCSHDAEHVNHAVLAVGYGVDPVSAKPYWLIKNSWDYTWGDSGYFRMEAFKNMCGVADCNSFPDLYGARL
jgi:cathepsin H